MEAAVMVAARLPAMVAVLREPVIEMSPERALTVIAPMLPVKMPWKGLATDVVESAVTLPTFQVPPVMVPAWKEAMVLGMASEAPKAPVTLMRVGGGGGDHAGGEGGCDEIADGLSGGGW